MTNPTLQTLMNQALPDYLPTHRLSSQQHSVASNTRSVSTSNNAEPRHWAVCNCTVTSVHINDPTTTRVETDTAPNASVKPANNGVNGNNTMFYR
jgi:hypothetical protein